MFEQLLSGNDDVGPSEILNKFFASEEIDNKTILTMDQIRVERQLLWVLKMKGMPEEELNFIIDFFDKYKIQKLSKNGIARKQVLEGLKSQALMEQQTLMGRQELK